MKSNRFIFDRHDADYAAYAARNEELIAKHECLIEAIRNSDFEGVKFLVNNGAPVMPIQVWESRIPNPMTAYAPLCIAAKNGNVEILTFLLQQKDVDINRPEAHSSYTPLHYAVKHLEIVQLLIDNKAFIDPASGSGTTPLYLAVLLKNEEVARLLFDKGASPYVRPRLCVVYDKPKFGRNIFELLEEKNALNGTLFGRNEYRNKELAKYMRENYKADRDYFTP